MNDLDNDPFLFDDDPLGDDDALGTTSVGVGTKSDGRGAFRIRLPAAGGLALAVVALVAGALGAGWATVAVGVVAYGLATASDVHNRTMRKTRRIYTRPWPTSICRLAVFGAAVGAAWMAASELAAT